MVYFGFEVYVKLKGICIEYIYVWVGENCVGVYFCYFCELFMSWKYLV